MPKIRNPKIGKRVEVGEYHYFDVMGHFPKETKKVERNKKRDSMFYKWISTTLVNDEVSSDKELESHFKKEGKMTKKEAICYIKQRDKALLEPLRFKLKKCK